MGLIQKLIQDHLPKRENNPETDPVKALTFKHIKSSIIFLMIGLGLATVSFVMEVIAGSINGERRIRKGL